MTQMLVFQQQRLTSAHRETLARQLPGMEITYCDNDADDRQMAGAEVIFGNPAPDRLSACGSLRLLQLASAGSNQYVDAVPKGAVLANASGAYGLAISEHLFAMLLHLQKKLHLYGRNHDRHLWKDEGPISSVYGSTVLVVGLGDIGGEFARRAHAFGGYTVGVRRVGTDKPDYLDELHTTDQLDLLLPRADIVALCLPDTPQTTGIMNRQRLVLMKDTAILLNVGRGSAIDQQALLEALRQGKLGGAGIDVTDPEPLPADHPLWEAPNLLITPHISGGDHLAATYNRIVDIAVGNIKAMAAGTPLRNVVDLSTGYRKL